MDVREFGAVGDGVTDDTRAVRAAVGAVVAAGGGTMFFPPGVYLVNTVYVNASNVTVRGAGPGLTVLRRKPGAGIDCRVIAVNSRHQTHTASTYLHDVRVEALTIDGNNQNVSSNVGSATVQGALMAGLVEGLTIRDVTVVDPREIGVNLLGCVGADLENVTVDGMAGENVVNSFNIFGGLVQAGPGGAVTDPWPSRGIRLRSCRVIRNWVRAKDLPGNANGGIAVCVQSSTDVIITGCTIDVTGEQPHRGHNTKGIIFEGGGVPGHLMLGRSYVAEGNTVRGCQTGVGCVDSNAGADTTGIMDGVTITGNQIHDCTDGVNAHGRNVSITGNTITAGTPLRLGIVKNSVEGGFTVTGNTLTPTAGNGVHMSKATNAPYQFDGLTITGNHINGAGAAGCGIYSIGAVHNFTITGNTIRDTAEAGIYFANGGGPENPRATNGVVTGNTLSNVCRAETIGYPRHYGVASAGVDNVTVGLNTITGGPGMKATVGSVNAGHLTTI